MVLISDYFLKTLLENKPLTFYCLLQENELDITKDVVEGFTTIVLRNEKTFSDLVCKILKLEKIKTARFADKKSRQVIKLTVIQDKVCLPFKNVHGTFSTIDADFLANYCEEDFGDLNIIGRIKVLNKRQARNERMQYMANSPFNSRNFD